jgi:hypothetical protein
MRTCTILLLTGTILSFVSVSCVMPAAAQDQAKTASPPAPAASSVPVPTATPPQKAPAPGAISRSTGHLFREGLAAGISADGVKKKSLSKANDKGLLMSTADGALPSAPLWGPTSADDIKSMLTLLVPNPHFEPANEIARRLLLTHTPWPENDDLKALRLQKMIEFGAGVQAGQLYSSWAPESPSLPLLKMGVTALILSGQPSVACLELGAQKSKWGQDKDPFFKTISNNCISYIKKGITNQSPLSPMGPNDWHDHLGEYAGKQTRTDSQAGMVLRLYAQAKAGQTSKDWIDTYTALYPHLSNQTRMEFAAVLGHIPFSSLTADAQKKAIIGTLIRANNPKAKEWVQNTVQTQEKNPIHNTAHAALILAAALQENSAKEWTIPLSFAALAQEKKVNLGKIFKFLSEMLDTAPRFIDTPGVVYEKKRDLTSAYNYVMPWKVLQNHFKQGRESGSIGRMVLASLLMIQAFPPDSPDPEAVKLVIQSWENAGLKEEARQYATSVLLGVNEIGDK